MQAFLDWCRFYQNGSKPKKDSVPQINKIDKYFQVDLCAYCGLLGGEQTPLKPCARTRWLDFPTIPDWSTGSKSIDSPGATKNAWREACVLAEKSRGRSVCSNDVRICFDCFSKHGSAAYKKVGVRRLPRRHWNANGSERLEG